jgi:sterol desaturase/sphingolipid hydroxylase (fatty acid hydroxylase superfamily)
MRLLLSDEARLLGLVVGCAVLWSLESIAPLYRVKRQRLIRALPNIALAGILVVTNLALSLLTAKVSSLTADNELGVLFLVTRSPWLALILGIVVLDLSTYVAHLLLHKSWLGWQFHRVHHSDNEVNVTTAFRQHPGETFWRILWQVLAGGIFGIPATVVLVYLMISTLNAQLEHANIKLVEYLDRPLRWLFVTPNMHKIHHSRQQIQTDTNYSNIFSIWDRIFGTYTGAVDFAVLRYGLDGLNDKNSQNVAALLKLPFCPSKAEVE